MPEQWAAIAGHVHRVRVVRRLAARLDGTQVEVIGTSRRPWLFAHQLHASEGAALACAVEQLREKTRTMEGQLRTARELLAKQRQRFERGRTASLWEEA